MGCCQTYLSCYISFNFYVNITFKHNWVFCKIIIFLFFRFFHTRLAAIRDSKKLPDRTLLYYTCVAQTAVGPQVGLTGFCGESRKPVIVSLILFKQY